MSLKFNLQDKPTSRNSRSGSDFSKRFSWMKIARLSWAAFAFVSLGLFIASLPAHYEMVVNFSTHWLGNTRIISQMGIPISAYAIYMLSLSSILVCAYIGVGALIFLARPNDRMALLSAFILVASGVTWPNTLESLKAYPNSSSILALLIGMIGTLGFTLFFWLAYLFPSGSFVPRWTWIPAAFFLLSVSLINLFPNTVFDINTWHPVLNYGLFLGIIATMIFAPVYRYRKVSTPVQRQQLRWIAFSLVIGLTTFAILGIAGNISSFISNDVAGSIFALTADTILMLALLLFPIAVGISIMRYRLWNIDIIINRSILYGTLTVLIIAAYMLIVSSLGILLHSDSNQIISLIAAGFVAVIFQPLRERLQRIVNRLVYGQRDEPFKILQHLGQIVELTPVNENSLNTLVNTISQALNFPYVAIEITYGKRKEILTSCGIETINSQRFPLVHQAVHMGDLLVSPRTGEHNLSSIDTDLLSTISRQAGAIVHAIQLKTDLQRSRERLVISREEERRRIRRNLHDGLGPVIASLAMQADHAREFLHRDPDQTEKMLVDIMTKTQGVISEIRRLVYDLRPPALDELGLLGALRAYASQLQQKTNVEIIAPEFMPALPAAVEVAVFRIAQEALNNVVRHSNAHQCRLHLSFSDQLQMEICDDGVGLPANAGTGLGLVSMRERAEELGGEFTVESVDIGGTRILVKLPFKSSGWSKTDQSLHQDYGNG